MKLKIFSQNVCPACRNLENYMSNEHPETEYEHINIDESPEAVDEYAIMGTPTIVLWDEDDQEEVARHTGFDFGPGKEYVLSLIAEL